MIAALQLERGGTEDDPDQAAQALMEQAEQGWIGHQDWSLPGQEDGYTIAEEQLRDTRSWVIDGSQIFRLDNTKESTGTVPLFTTLQTVKQAIEEKGLKISWLQQMYRDALPQGLNAVWKADWGTTQLKHFSVNQWIPSTETDFTRLVRVYFQIPNPEPANADLFKLANGQKNGVAQVRQGRCISPVNMFDQKPTFAVVGALGIRSNGWRPYDVARYVFDGGGTLDSSGVKVKVKRSVAQESYDRTVRSGAVPLYNLAAVDGWGGDHPTNHDLLGVGVMPRCNDDVNPYINTEVTPTVVEVKEQARTGLWTKLSAAPKATVKAKSVDRNSKLRVRVDPDLLKGRYTVRVQKKAACRGDDGRCWRTTRVLKTRAVTHARTINLPRGRYRGVLPAGQNGLPRAVSKVVTLKR